MFFTRKPAIEPSDAADRLARRDLVLIDVRQPGEMRHGRIHGSVNIPLGELRDRLHELDQNREIAFLCHSGARSSRATGIAIKAGYAALNVRGGLIAWRRAGLPVGR